MVSVLMYSITALPSVRPEVTATEVVVETGFAASEAFPGGNAKPFNEWGDQMPDAYGDPIEE